MTPLALFDFDGTLTTSDSVVPFLRRFVRPAASGRAVREVAAVARAVAARDRDRLRAAATRALLTGVPFGEVQAAGHEFAAEILAGRLRDDTRARLGWHVDQGHRVAFVSASYDVYLLPVAAALGVEAVLSTRLEVREGVCTGALDGPNCRGPEKVRRLEAWLGSQGVAAADVQAWAYGDSAGDTELLAWAHHPVWAQEPLTTIAPA